MAIYKYGTIEEEMFVLKLIRKEIKFEVLNDSNISYNYYYSISQIIYNSFSIVDSKKASELHDSGYTVNKKKLRLFNFHLFFKNALFDKQHISIKAGDELILVISGVDTIVEDIAEGLLAKSQVELFTTELLVKSVNEIPDQLLGIQTLYKLNSAAICMGKTEYNVFKNGKLFKRFYDYKSPFSNEFYNLLAINLKEKYKAVYGKDYTGDLYFDIENTAMIKKKTIGGIKNKYFKKGYIFNIWLQSDVKMQKIAFYLGIGSHNSLGAGFVTIITRRRAVNG